MFLASWGSVKKNTHMHQTPPSKKKQSKWLINLLGDHDELWCEWICTPLHLDSGRNCLSKVTYTWVFIQNNCSKLYILDFYLDQ